MRWLLRAAGAAVLLAIIGFCVLAAIIASYGAQTDPGPADAAIVLGAAVLRTEPSPVFAERLRHAAELYKAGASTAVPETLEASLQLSEAVLVDLGVAMGPVIASIHEKRDEFRESIRERAALDHKPKLRTSTQPG